MSKPKRLKFRRARRELKLDLKLDFNFDFSLEPSITVLSAWKGWPSPVLQECRPLTVADIQAVADKIHDAGHAIRCAMLPARCALVEVLAFLPRTAGALKAAMKAQDFDNRLREAVRRPGAGLELNLKWLDEATVLDPALVNGSDRLRLASLFYSAAPVRRPAWPDVVFVA